MDNLAADFTIENNCPIEVEYTVEPSETFDCSFEIFATRVFWGGIEGNITDQTDLMELLNTKVDLTDFEELSQTVTNNYNKLTGDIADLTTTVTNNYNTLSGQISDLTGVVNDNYTSLDNRLTTAEGSILDLTDTVNDNYTELDGKITTTNNNLSTLSQTVEDNNTAINNRVDGIVDSFDGDISDLNDAIDNLSDTVADNYTDLDGKITNLNGTVSNNYTELNGKITDNTDDITIIQNTINSYGDIVSYNAAYFATANQGALADTSLQPNDNITLLNNNAGYITGIDNSDVVTALGYTPYNASNPAGYITAASLPTVNNNTITIQKNGVNVDSFTLNQNSNKSINITVPTNNNELTNGAGYITSADIPTLADLTTTAQLEAINSGATSTKIGQIATNTQNIADEVTNRQNADNGLQSQIDAIVSSSDVFDIVGTYAELQAYDISTVPVNDIIKVLVDSTHSNAATYYRCVESGSVKTWSYIGSEGAYYTKSEADGRFVAQTITVNGQPLSSNVTLTASDVGALPDSTVIPTVNNSTITIQKNSTTVDTFTLNQSSAKTINISVPTDTADLTNGAGYIKGITSGDVTTALGYTPYNSTNPSGYITSSALSPYALISSLSTVATSGSYNDLLDKPYIPSGVIVDQIYDSSSTNAQSGVAIAGAGFLTSITSSDVTTALGYTPYNSTNPSGYITSSALTNYVTTNTAQNIFGKKTFLGEKAIYFKQNATSDKLGFTLYNPSNAEVGGLEYRPNTINGNSLLALNCPQATGGYVGFRYWGSPAVNIVAPKVATAGNYYIPVNLTDGTNTVTANNNGTLNISSLLPDISDMATQTWVTNQGYTTNVGTVTSVNNTQPDASGNVTLTIPDTATWGNITGTLSNQTDLQTALDAKQNTISDLSTIRSGASLGTTALQPNDNITELVNNAGYITGITSSDVITALGYTPYNSTNPNGYITSADLPTVDQTYNGTSANPQSGVAIEGELSTNYQPKLVSGTNIKTINNTSLLGSGNIDTTEVFVAEYNITDYSDVLTAYNTGKKIFLKKGYSSPSDNYTYLLPLEKYGTIASNFTGFVFSVIEGLTKKTFTLSSSNTWDMSTIELSDNTLSNVSSIDSNSAVKTALDGKVSKSGDTMTGMLNISKDSISESHFINLVNENITKGTNPAQITYTSISFNDRTNDSSYLNTRMGCVECTVNANGTVGMTLAAMKNEVGANIRAQMQVKIDSSGDASCTFPDTTCVDGQWVNVYQDIISSDTALNGSSDLHKRIPVPNDDYVYEALLIARATTGSTSGNLVRVQINTNVISADVTICSNRTRSASTVECQGAVIVPIKGVASNSTNLNIGRASSLTGNLNVLRLIAYRRVGTNS